jgi:hypothetical protein
VCACACAGEREPLPALPRRLPLKLRIPPSRPCDGVVLVCSMGDVPDATDSGDTVAVTGAVADPVACGDDSLSNAVLCSLPVISCWDAGGTDGDAVVGSSAPVVILCAVVAVSCDAASVLRGDVPCSIVVGMSRWMVLAAADKGRSFSKTCITLLPPPPSVGEGRFWCWRITVMVFSNTCITLLPPPPNVDKL